MNVIVSYVSEVTGFTFDFFIVVSHVIWILGTKLGPSYFTCMCVWSVSAPSMYSALWSLKEELQMVVTSSLEEQ